MSGHGGNYDVYGSGNNDDDANANNNDNEYDHGNGEYNNGIIMIPNEQYLYI